MSAEVILQHGWGMSSHCWLEWQTKLQQLNYKCTVAERGYFGQPRIDAAFSKLSRRRILIVHSLGLHLIDKNVLQDAETVIAFGSFLYFHERGEDVLASKRSRRMLSAMSARLEESPLDTLREFWTNCGHPAKLLPNIDKAKLDIRRLQSDLHLLDQNVIAPTVFANKQLIVAHGQNDAIVNIAAALQLAGSKDNLQIINGAGHALPFSNFSVCFEMLSPYLPTATPALRLCQQNK